MSLPIYQDRQTPSAQYRQWLMGVAGDAYWTHRNCYPDELFWDLRRLLHSSNEILSGKGWSCNKWINANENETKYNLYITIQLTVHKLVWSMHLFIGVFPLSSCTHQSVGVTYVDTYVNIFICKCYVIVWEIMLSMNILMLFWIAYLIFVMEFN